MFNVLRTKPAPACLTRKIYNDQEVVDRLNDMFHGKCYLCEKDQLSEPEIEHLKPHGGDESLKYDWNNLYFVCRRCNGIKGSSHINILDCCDANINVFKKIRHILPSIPGKPVQIEATDASVSVEVSSTIELLDRCFNEDDTPLRKLTHHALHEEIFFHYEKFLARRNTVASIRSTPHEVNEAMEALIHMATIAYPFSVFWRWHILMDPKLLQKMQEKINF